MQMSFSNLALNKYIYINQKWHSVDSVSKLSITFYLGNESTRQPAVRL